MERKSFQPCSSSSYTEANERRRVEQATSQHLEPRLMSKRKRSEEDAPFPEKTYAPLSHEVDSSFRICTLLPGAQTAPISCKLSQDDWAYSPYEAISYVWGASKPKKVVRLNGKPFHVGANLEALLRQLRRSGRGQSKERSLWVDAICIDQENLRERGHQVQRMYDIYHAAEQVVVWLGGSHYDSDLAFDFMNKQLRSALEGVGFSCTDEQKNAAKASFWDQWDEGKEAKTLEAIEHLTVKKYAKCWMAVIKLLQRPWWNRAWTVQELISARRVSIHCGSSSAPWPLMEMTIQLMLRNVDIENLLPKKDRPSFHNAIEDAHAFAYERYHRVRGGQGPESFPQLMQVTRCRQSQDPRDKVFSILSLLDSNSTKYGYEPDYAEPVHAAYVRAARAHIASSKSLHVLSSCCYSDCDIVSDLPSWVPSWDKVVDMSYLGGYSAKDIEFNYTASGKATADVEFSADMKVLRARGIMIDTVKESCLQNVIDEFDYLYTSATEEPWMSWDLHSMVRHLEDEPRIKIPERETILQAVLKTLIADRHPETGKRRHELELRRIKQHYWPRAADLEAYLSHVQMFTQGRTPVLSTDGYVGLAPKSTKVGDKICVLYGCHAPVILRPRAGDVDEYTLIGDAYVHGIMDGEAVVGLPSDPAKKIFVIR